MRLFLIITCISFFAFMPYDSVGKKCVITRVHQAIPTYDTLLVSHYHQSGAKVYVILKGGRALWVDECYELDTLEK